MRYLMMLVLMIISFTITGCTNDNKQSYKNKKTKELKKINSDAQDR